MRCDAAARIHIHHRASTTFSQRPSAAIARCHCKQQQPSLKGKQHNAKQTAPLARIYEYEVSAPLSGRKLASVSRFRSRTESFCFLARSTARHGATTVQCHSSSAASHREMALPVALEHWEGRPPLRLLPRRGDSRLRDSAAAVPVAAEARKASCKFVGIKFRGSSNSSSSSRRPSIYNNKATGTS